MTQKRPADSFAMVAARAVTFKPAVEDAWQTDLESHVDFDGWQYLSRNSDSDTSQISAKKPLVYFGSFQDLLGRDLFGNIKPRTNGCTYLDE